MNRLFIASAFLLIQSGFSNPVEKLVNEDFQLNHLIDSLQLNTKNLSIHINKSDYNLSIGHKGIVIKQYHVVFGGNPEDDKLREGDQCTPEGRFSVRDHYPHKSWSKFIWIDYPTKDSWKKHELAKEKGQIPDDAEIGGEIGIHGVPEGFDHIIRLKENWTLGCISMSNKDLNELYPYVFHGMIITISK